MKKYLVRLLLILCMCCVVPASVSAAEKKTGWEKAANGKKYYYVKGKLAKGFVDINGKTYYFRKGTMAKNKWFFVKKVKYRASERGVIYKNRFITVDGKKYYLNAKGAVQKSWKVLNGKRYYFGADGVMRTGLSKIHGNYYYFNEKGVAQTGILTVGKTTYVLNSKGKVEAKIKNDKVTDGAGKALSSTKSLHYLTLLRAKRIAGQITNSSMSQEQKLRKCFEWVMSKYYVTPRQFRTTEGWTAVFANDHFLNGKGNCHSDACAFAYLAKAIGYTEVYVCVDSDGTNPSGHSWTEINGLAYDPLFAEAKSFSANYAAPYGTYILHPILRVKI